jgi:transcriptional regulator with XRE-family HTH domain
MISVENRPIVDRIKNLRLKEGLSQAKFAELIGVSPGNVGQWETYSSLPGAAALKEIAQKLECSSDWILFGIEKSQEESIDMSADVKSLISLYNELDDEGKTIVKSACYQERRRVQTESSSDLKANRA